jgi:hypothetical protein
MLNERLPYVYLDEKAKLLSPVPKGLTRLKQEILSLGLPIHLKTFLRLKQKVI